MSNLTPVPPLAPSDFASAVGVGNFARWLSQLVNFINTLPTSLSGLMPIIVPVSDRAYNSTASLSAVTIAAGILSTNIATPASTITVTLAAPTGDGETRRIVFGAATTVTWAVTSPATAAVIPKTSFAKGESIELIYNAVAGSPTNAPATSWIVY